jgi:hypothetical protein
VPVFVERPGVLRIEWVGGDPLRALGQHVEVGPKLTLDLDRRSGDFEARLRGLLVRGDRLAAVELVRNELGLSLSDARRRVEELEHKAA